MKRILLTALIASAVAGAPARAQDWRRVDPTDPSNTGYAQPQRPSGGDAYSDIRVRTGGEQAPLTQDRGDYTRADIWQVANRSPGGSFPIDNSDARASQALPDQKRPWSSTFWPFQDCYLAFKSFSPDGLTPMETYDTYVNASQGQNPGAAAWEASSVAKTLVVGGGGDFGRPGLVWQWKLGHNMAPWMEDPQRGTARVPAANGGSQIIQVDWWGHCNGWAAAACLVPEPPEEIRANFSQPVTRLTLKSRDPLWPGQNAALGVADYTQRNSGSRTLTFTGADLKGLYTEAYLSTASTYQHPDKPDFYTQEDFGRRYDSSRGQSEENDAAFRDVLPHHFHRIMLDHMGREKGLVADKDADDHVNNLPIVGWTYIRRYNPGQRAYDFRCRVYYADYAAPTYRGTKLLPIDYDYRIYLDEQNRVYDSAWLGKSVNEHPDFMWVPDKPMPAPLKRNPAIKLEVLDEIVRQARG